MYEQLTTIFAMATAFLLWKNIHLARECEELGEIIGSLIAAQIKLREEEDATHNE